ncbi:MAG: SAM-dependent methyltransferase [Pseudonocardiaceae bacterium]
MSDRDTSVGEIDFDVPSPARMYDYFLGGAQNSAADRASAEEAIARFPNVARTAQANRSFLGRAVRYCLETGIDQFLDLGSGIPTVGNVHEVAHAVNPDARVAYVDCEPVAAIHARHLLRDTSGVTITEADLRQPDVVLGSPGVAGLLDFTRPVALLTVSVLHFIDDLDDPWGIVARYRRALPPGSALVLSHVSDDQPDEELAAAVRAVNEIYRRTTTAGGPRDRAAIEAMFAGFTLVEPGLVDLVHWRPTEDSTGADRSAFYGAVGHLDRQPESSGAA